MGGDRTSQNACRLDGTTTGFSLGQPIARGYALPAKSVRMQRLRAEHRYSGQQMRNR
jgi:hypothetical protein